MMSHERKAMGRNCGGAVGRQTDGEVKWQKSCTQQGLLTTHIKQAV
jgi:hypothetical protein